MDFPCDLNGLTELFKEGWPKGSDMDQFPLFSRAEVSLPRFVVNKKTLWLVQENTKILGCGLNIASISNK